MIDNDICQFFLEAIAIKFSWVSSRDIFYLYEIYIYVPPSHK